MKLMCTYHHTNHWQMARWNIVTVVLYIFKVCTCFESSDVSIESVEEENEGESGFRVDIDLQNEYDLRNNFDFENASATVTAEESEPLHQTAADSEWVVDERVQFYLYRSYRGGDVRSHGIAIHNLQDLIDGDFRRGEPTKIIIHGFRSNYTKGPGKKLLKAYFSESQKESLNVILVDWSSMAKGNGPIEEVLESPELRTLLRSTLDLYREPAENTKAVGKLVGNFIKLLINQGGTSGNKIHLIGHSLGAHVAGTAGHRVQPEIMVDRITALDPASPCFEKSRALPVVPVECPNSSKYRPLSKYDARFVDVIHTDPWVLGYYSAIGHMDVFPDFAPLGTQPGCPSLHQGGFRCSHSRAIDLMAESIHQNYMNMDSTGYVESCAVKCSSWSFFSSKCVRAQPLFTTRIGEYVSRWATGQFYIKTKSDAPHLMLRKSQLGQGVTCSSRRNLDLIMRLSTEDSPQSLI